MSIQFSQPFYFMLSFFLIPALLFFYFRSKKIISLLMNYAGKNKKMVHGIKSRIVFRSFCWSLAWLCICIALTGPSWGTELVPVQKSGRSVGFVFDISHSMTAKDIQGNSLSRLEYSKQFSQELLSVLPGVATSAVLAKGDGVLAVPLTEDYYAISNLITSLSPYMLSHPGSSLSKGVLKAIESFPPQSARSSYIIVMSDGDDTDANLADAIDKAVSFGIHVVFVGFGSENEIEIITGDGVTRVKTALRSEKLQTLAQENFVDFVFADDTHAIDSIVQIIKPSIFFSDNATTASYELSPIKRHGFFILVAIISFLIGLLVYVFEPSKILKLLGGRAKSITLLLVIMSSSLFTGCNDWFTDARDVLEGSYQWTQQNYQESVASFLEVTTRAQEKEDLEMLQYGLFGLSCGYLMQGESEASLTKINEMNPVVSVSLDFSRWYNKGIIFHRKGDYESAAFCFKKALLIDSTNINAKINLELCLNDEKIETQQGIQERIPVQEQNDSFSGAAEAVFSVIRRNEENQWKTQEVAPEKSDIIDY